MQITSSYQVRTVRCSVSLDDTVRIYQLALSYLIGIVNDNWDAVRSITTGALEQRRYIEKLVHGNKNREFKYPEFDKKFHKYPSYLRRATITAAIGAVSEDPKSFGKSMIFVVLGEGVALYGLLISILIINKV